MISRPRINRTVRTIVAVSIVAAVVGVWLWKTITGQATNPITFALVIVYAVAGGYVVFGPRVFDDAVETAQEIQGGGEGDGDDSPDNVAETPDEDPRPTEGGN